jgi:hypothetical protein
MVDCCQGIAVSLVAEQKLAFVVCAPEPIGYPGVTELCALHFMAASFARLDEIMPVENAVDSAGG